MYLHVFCKYITVHVFTCYSIYPIMFTCLVFMKYLRNVIVPELFIEVPENML